MSSHSRRTYSLVCSRELLYGQPMIWVLIPVVFVIVVLKFWFTWRPMCPGGSLKPNIEQVLNQKYVQYDLNSFDLPVITGLPFKLFIWLSYTRFGRYFIISSAMRKNNLDRMARVQIPEFPTYYPIPDMYGCLEDHSTSNQKILHECVEMEVEERKGEFHLPTVVDFVRAYRSHKTTPIEVAVAVLDAIAHSDKADPPLRAVVQSNRDVVLAMASASNQRWKEENTLSYLDGVPVAIKEGFHCEPYDFRGGASYIPIISKGVPEAVCVRKLKRAGAVIIGVTNMHEFGTGTLGSNPHPPHLTGRNPYDPRHYAGGSSTGSGISVAAGFCPVAIGTDGGGSIRIPASLCGTVGLKPTHGIVDSFGVLPSTFTVGVTGPLTASVLDTAITMDIISQVTDGEKKVVSLEGLGKSQLDGLKVGVFWEHFNDADKEITLQCRAALSHLQNLGAELVDIRIPEMKDSRIAHTISISTEFGSSLGLELDHHYSEVNLETHLTVGMSASISAIQYVNSQKQRTRAMLALKSIFKKVDMIATPAVACSPPMIQPEAIKGGIADASNSAKLNHFSFLGNLTGIPCLVLPVGYTDAGLPVGLQLMGSWYREDVLLRTGLALEQSGHFPTKKPKIFYDVISK